MMSKTRDQFIGDALNTSHGRTELAKAMVAPLHAAADTERFRSAGCVIVTEEWDSPFGLLWTGPNPTIKISDIKARRYFIIDAPGCLIVDEEW